MKYRVYERDRIYPQNISAYLDLFKFSPRKYPFIANHFEVITFYNDYFWWARDLEKLKRTTTAWIKRWIKDDNELRKVEELYEKSRAELKKKIHLLKRVDIKKVSLTILYNLYKNSTQLFLRNITFSEYITDTFDDFFGEILESHLKKQANITQEDLAELLRPAYVSEGLLYKKKLLEASLKNRPDLRKIRDQFEWIAMSWDGNNSMTIDKIKKDISEVSKQPVQERSNEIKRIINLKSHVIRKRKEILKKYKIRNTSRLFHMLDKFTMYHDYRKETQMRCNIIILDSLKQMSNFSRVKYRDLLFYFNDELKDLCINRKKVNPKVIKERQKGLTFIVKEGSLKIITGGKAYTVLNDIVLSKLKAGYAQELLGIIANKGRATGKAVISLGAKEASRKVSNGNIIVASMTTPDYLPAIKRAAAIVTDDGGITSHAAIVAREFHIPCIVGTKIATRVFKDGDLIEVDADKGVVRKVK